MRRDIAAGCCRPVRRPSYSHLKSSLLEEARNTGIKGDSLEYVTYLRARRLAEVMGVRTRFVHTNSLDLILRRDADPGSLLRAQVADMKGKGWVIAALLLRAYHSKWGSQVERLPPAIMPEAMVRLAQFARDFANHEPLDVRQRGPVRQRLLRSGIWLAPSANEYSLVVVPVLWPPISEKGAPPKLPKRLNTTGAGDMTFGAFFYLGGV